MSPPWRLGRGSTLLAYRIVIPQFHNDLMAALQHGRGKAQAHAAASFLHKKFKPIGARSGYAIASLFLPGIRSQPPFSMASALCQLLTASSAFSFSSGFKKLHDVEQGAVHSRAADSGCSIQADFQDGRIRP